MTTRDKRFSPKYAHLMGFLDGDCGNCKTRHPMWFIIASNNKQFKNAWSIQECEETGHRQIMEQNKA